jgi:hypothetical protein
MIRAGDTVQIKPEWQDAGDDKYQWVAVTDESMGRIDITPIDIGLAIKPVYTVKIEMLET